MGYTMLKNNVISGKYQEFSLEKYAIQFIREACEELRFDTEKFCGKSIGKNTIPYNMEKDIDRLCLEKAIDRFLKSGKKEDAFDVYFCYLEMFIGDYKKTRRMIELLSEFESNGSGLLMKHRDHYSHSVYVFCLGLAIYESNQYFKEAYKKYYNIEDEKTAAHQYLQYWGLTSLFHDIGYPFELPFEQVCSYFEVDKKDENGKKHEHHRGEYPFVAYHALESFIKIDEATKKKLKNLLDNNREFSTTDELFAYILANKLGKAYSFSENDLLKYLTEKPVKPDKFGYFMDHAYFSSTILFKKLFEEMDCELNTGDLDALTAILLHNSLYKFCIANPNMDSEKPEMHLSYKDEGNIKLKAELHPLAYMLMLCDELQCWDRTAYGRDSKVELHPMGCFFDFSNNGIKATYLYDECERAKIDNFKNEYIEALQNPNPDRKMPKLKAYSGMYIKKDGKSDFQNDIERIIDLEFSDTAEIKFSVEIGITKNIHKANRSYLSDSKFINLYNFAIVLNGRWNSSDWRNAKDAGVEASYLNNDEVKNHFIELFDELSLEYKLSNINQAKAFAKHMNEIDCFYTDRPVDFEMVESFTEEELKKIGVSEHQRWLQEHYDMGWTYGVPEKNEREFLRQHKDMIPQFDGKSEVSLELAKTNYERLDKSEQDKDTEPMECMLALLRIFDGLRIYRLK